MKGSIVLFLLYGMVFLSQASIDQRNVKRDTGSFPFSEGFDDITRLEPNGWAIVSKFELMKKFMSLHF